jgi:hypothetical protein
MVFAAMLLIANVIPAAAFSLRWPPGIAPIDELAPTLAALAAQEIEDDETGGHLLVSEVMTGGASASDEFIELYNPTATWLPLEALEVVYVTASGATVSRRATWGAGSPAMPPGGHLLIANESGIFASIADARYASGMAAAGGSVAIRIVGAAGPIDAVGWGTAASAWIEGTPAVAPPAGSSLERLPGGPFGSAQDSEFGARARRL